MARPPSYPRPPAPPPPPRPQPRNPTMTGRQTAGVRTATPPPRPSANATMPPRPATQRTGVYPRAPNATIPPRAPNATIPPRSANATIPPRAPNATIPPRSANATIPPRPGARLVSRAQNPTQPTIAPRAAEAPSAPARAAPPQGPRPGAARRKKVRKAGAVRRARAMAAGGARQWGQGRALWGVVVLLLLVVGAIGGYYGYLFHEFNAPGPSTAAERLAVSQGASLKGVLNQLSSKGVLGDKMGTLMYLRLTGENPHVKAGTYEFPAHASPAKIIAMLNDGKVVLEQVTVIEGSTFADFRRTLDESPVVTHALRGKSDAQVMAALGHARELPEGRFFPDTYLFAAQTSDLEILQIAYNKMQHLLDKEWPGHDSSLPYSTPYEALTMASLVEKETGVSAERPRIAGVFINRLRKGMRLQTDPAVIYGLGPAYDGNIHKKDLETDNPYNTYTRSGLPPTPIALPSKEAVLAAIHPDNTDALYFVATGSGGHHFSATLEEHNAAVRSYLSHRAQGGSAGGQ